MPTRIKRAAGAGVLIIEDNASNLELMTYLLEAFGHQVSKAETGVAGLEKALAGDFDVVLCDIHLPDIGGEEIAARLKSSSSTRSLPLIAVTALAMMGDRDRLMAAGFDGYIAKPLDPETFVTQVELFARLSPSLARHAEITQDSSQERQQLPSRGTVLVLDDSVQDRYFLRFLLEPKGFHVDECATIADAMARAHEQRPDLIISDVNLANNEDGEDFLLRVKHDPSLHDIPVILITSTDKPSNAKVMRVKTAGAEAFLVRPLSPDEVLRAIEAALPEGSNAE